MNEQRKSYRNKILDSRSQDFENVQLKIQHNNIVMIMAEYLQKKDKLEEAKKLYDILFCPHKVFEILDLQESAKRKKKN
jgi:uncharacterized protein (DUF305 family)